MIFVLFMITYSHPLRGFKWKSVWVLESYNGPKKKQGNFRKEKVKMKTFKGIM